MLDWIVTYLGIEIQFITCKLNLSIKVIEGVGEGDSSTSLLG
jgi:hypothetical protein